MRNHLRPRTQRGCDSPVPITLSLTQPYQNVNIPLSFVKRVAASAGGCKKMSFIKIEKKLLKSTLSKSAILCYGLLADRIDLSKANGWQDDRGYYVMFSRQNIANELNLKVRRVCEILKELKDARLIETVRTANNNNKIYVLPVPEGFSSSAPAAEPEKFDFEKLIDQCARLENVYLDAQKRQEVLEKVLPRLSTVKNKVGYIRSVLRNWKSSPAQETTTSYDIELYESENYITKWDESQ